MTPPSQTSPSLRSRQKALFQSLRRVGFSILESNYKPPIRRSNLGWRWVLRLTRDNQRSTPVLTDVNGVVEIDPAHADLRVFLDRIAKNHGFSTFPIDSVEFGNSGALTKPKIAFYDFRIDASDW
jgi:hypothetical protein